MLDLVSPGTQRMLQILEFWMFFRDSHLRNSMENFLARTEWVLKFSRHEFLKAIKQTLSQGTEEKKFPWGSNLPWCIEHWEHSTVFCLCWYIFSILCSFLHKKKRYSNEAHALHVEAYTSCFGQLQLLASFISALRHRL